MPSPIRELLNTVRQFTQEPSPGVSRSANGQPAPGVLELLATYGALAPSAYNTQPWEFRATADALEIWVDHARGASVGGAAQREQVIACGAALFNARVALRHFGYRDIVQVCPDPGELRRIARIEAGAPASESAYNRSLFHAIPKRHTVRVRHHAFESRAVEPAIVDELGAAARASGAWLHVVTNQVDQCALADLVFEAGEEYEAAAGHLRSEDGFDGPADVVAVDDDAERLAHAIAAGEAHRASRALREAPVVAVLGTDGDDVNAWVLAGEALEHLLLRAASHGVFAIYANHPLRVAALRPWVKPAVGHDGSPHLLLGLGYSMG
jgi:nitroreductase